MDTYFFCEEVYIFYDQPHIKTEEGGSRMFRFSTVIITIFSLIFLISCNSESNQEADYQTTKKMVIDILQTEDGKKALAEVITDEEMKRHLLIESDAVKKAIDDILISNQGTEMWNHLFQDPNFVQDFAKSMEDAHKDLLKKLMNDADFQQQMLDILQNPEIHEQMLQLMKSQQFRAHLQETIQETIDTPSFQAQITELLLKAAEEKGERETSDENDEEDDDDEENESNNDKDEMNTEG